MSLTDEDRRETVRYRIEKAYRTLEEANRNVPFGSWTLVANRLYYAAYYAASSLLLADRCFVKSHEGNIQQFGRLYITTKKLDSKYGKLYHQLFENRLTGDYDDRYDLTEDDVFPMIAPTKEFVETVSRLATETLNN